MTTEFPAVIVITSYAKPELISLAQFLFDNRTGMTPAKRLAIERKIAKKNAYKGSSYTLKPAGLIGLRQLARIMRKPERHGDDLPWLILWQGEVAGATLALDTDCINAWRPGCFAVPLDESLPIHVATGGDYQRGAEKWEVV